MLFSKVEAFLCLGMDKMYVPRSCEYSTYFGLSSFPQKSRSFHQLFMGTFGSNQCVSTFTGLLTLHSCTNYQILEGSNQNLSASKKTYSPMGLNAVFSVLTKPPFEPPTTCSMSLLSMKGAFLVAITLGG